MQGGGGTKEVNQVLEELGVGRFQVMQLLPICTLYLIDGAEILVASSILDSLQTAWGFSEWMRGAFISIVFVGVLLGSILGGILGDAIGRRPTLLVSYFFVVAFSVLCAASQGPLQLMVARFFFGCGYGMGAGTAIAVTVESVPPSWRASLMNVCSLFFIFGEIFAASLLMIFMPQLSGYTGDTWRWVTLLAAAPGAVVLPFAALALQETPHYLLSKGYNDEALSVVKYIAAANQNYAAVDGLAGVYAGPALRMEPSEPGEVRADSGGTVEDGRRPLPKAVHDETTVLQRFAIAFSPAYRSIVLGGCYLLFAANFQFYGLMYALPLVFGHMEAVPVSPAFQVLVAAFWDFPGVVLVQCLIRSQKFGHRDGLIGLALLSSVCFAAMTSLDLGATWIWVSLPVTYMAKFLVNAFFTLAYVYIAEVFPSSCRTTAVGICVATSRLGSIIAPPLFDSLTTSLHHGRFFAVAAMVAVGAVVVTRGALTYERKNEALEEEAPSLAARAGREEGSSAALASKAAGEEVRAGGKYGTLSS